MVKEGKPENVTFRLNRTWQLLMWYRQMIVMTVVHFSSITSWCRRINAVVRLFWKKFVIWKFFIPSLLMSLLNWFFVWVKSNYCPKYSLVLYLSACQKFLLGYHTAKEWHAPYGKNGVGGKPGNDSNNLSLRI